MGIILQLRLRKAMAALEDTVQEGEVAASSSAA